MINFKCLICKKKYKFLNFKSMAKIGEWKLPRDWDDVLILGDHLVFEITCSRCNFDFERQFVLEVEGEY